VYFHFKLGMRYVRVAQIRLYRRLYRHYA